MSGRIRFAVALLLALALPVWAADPVAPRADHHQHLLSPAVAELQNAAFAPIPVADDLGRLLRERAAAWNDAKRLEPLFTADGIVFTGESWIQGGGEAARFLSTRFARAYELTPTRSGHGYVVGLYTRGGRPFGHFHLMLDKAGGEWRIASEVPVFPGPRISGPETAQDLVKYLDEAGIRRAVVLSDGYYFDSPKNQVSDREAKVRAENDWTADQVAQFKDRLVAFCSFNPLADHALRELERCASSGRFRGIKLHFGMSRVDLKDPEHVKKVRAVVEAANKRRMPLIVHVRADANYGRDEARVLVERIIAAAPDVTFQIAHLWGGEALSEPALQVYADAVSSGDPRMKNVYFDLAEVALVAGDRPEALQAIAGRMRQIGLARILFASDGPVAESQSPAEAWKTTRKLPLSEDEFRVIAEKVAPYLR